MAQQSGALLSYRLIGNPLGGHPLSREEEWLLRRRKISVKEAAELAGVSEDGFRRHYPHLIRQITPRRQTVELGDALDLPPPPNTAS